MTRALVVWQWTDGRRGHERQCEGLLGALQERVALDHHVLPITASTLGRVGEFLSASLPAQAALPTPDLIFGAGHRCGWPMLATRRARGGRAVCIMRPQLPRQCFDLCIIPSHDGVPPSANVIVSDGPLNPMRPAASREARLGVILLGGPSAHHGWDEAAMFAQLRQVLASAPAMDWWVSDSRRSPPSLAAGLVALANGTKLAKLKFVSHRELPTTWLPTVLARATQVWVSADSVSMIYEALSAGANVGVFAVPARRRDRITAIAADLQTRGRVMAVADAARGTAIAPMLLREAERVAALILARWPDLLTPP